MKDVAALAQVSIGTVSNVLNSPERVAPPTRARVESAIAKLGWVRNESARQLRAGNSNSIGMLVLDIGNPFFADLIRGAEEYCYQHGYSVQIGNSDQRAERETLLLNRFEEQRVSGVLLAPIGEHPAMLDTMRRRGIPTVLLDRSGGAPGFCSVGADDLEGGRLAGRHLLDKGHRRIAFVGGPSTLSQVRDRRRGLELAIDQVDPTTTMLAVSTPTLDTESGRVAAGELAAMPDPERPTAVFAANDLVAIGLLQGFVTLGLAVPGDVAIIGYDDIGFAAAAAVPLSSVRQPRLELAARAAAMLLVEIDALRTGARHVHRNLRMFPELVARRSTDSTIVI
jgi:LacI family transcriptional regulator